MRKLLSRIEPAIAGIALAAMVVLPLAEIGARALFKIGIPGSGPFVQHLTLWVGFLGAAIAAREGRLLTLASGDYMPQPWRRPALIVSSAVAAGVTALHPAPRGS